MCLLHAICVGEKATNLPTVFLVPPFLITLRFPEDSFYLNEDCWRLIRIGEGPLGFGKNPETRAVGITASSVQKQS